MYLVQVINHFTSLLIMDSSLIYMLTQKENAPIYVSMWEALAAVLPSLSNNGPTY